MNRAAKLRRRQGLTVGLMVLALPVPLRLTRENNSSISGSRHHAPDSCSCQGLNCLIRARKKVRIFANF